MLPGQGSQFVGNFNLWVTLINHLFNLNLLFRHVPGFLSEIFKGQRSNR